MKTISFWSFCHEPKKRLRNTGLTSYNDKLFFLLFSNETNIQNGTEEKSSVPEESKLTNETKVESNLDNQNATILNSESKNEENSDQEKQKQIFQVPTNLKSESEDDDDSEKIIREELVFVDVDDFKADESSFGPPLDESGKDINKLSKKIITGGPRYPRVCYSRF